MLPPLRRELTIRDLSSPSITRIDNLRARARNVASLFALFVAWINDINYCSFYINYDASVTRFANYCSCKLSQIYGFADRRDGRR